MSPIDAEVAAITAALKTVWTITTGTVFRDVLERLDRIAAATPRPATYLQTGAPLWLHECGRTESFVCGHTPNRGAFCPYCEAPGRWQALYVAPEAS